MKIGDLWVKLGLKKDEFSKGIKEAGNEVSGSGGLLGKIKGLKVGALAAWTAIAAGAVAMADKFAHTSQRLGDIWDQNVAGMKGAWRSFISAVNSTDFSNLGKRLANAFKDAKEIAASADQEFEVMNSIELRKSRKDKQLEELRVQMQNQKISQKARIDAANKYLAELRPIYEKEEKYRAEHAEKVKNYYLRQSKLANNAANQGYLTTFLEDVVSNPALTAALDKFSRNGGRTAAMSNAERRMIQELRDVNGTAGLEALSKLAQHYLDNGNEEARLVVDAITKANYAAGAFDKETRRVQNIANQAVTGGGDGGGNIPALSAFEMAIIRAKERMDDVLEDTMADIDKELLDLTNKSVEFEPVKIDPPDMTAWDEFYSKYSHNVEMMKEIVDGFREAVINGFTDACQEMMNQLFGLQEFNGGAIIQAMLTPLADMAIKAGEIIMAEGAATIAANSALMTFGETGWGAVAAGAALVAAGAAAKAGLGALARSGGASTATTSYGSAGASSVGAQTQTLQTEMTVYVTGRLSGSDILLSGQKTQNNWNR